MPLLLLPTIADRVEHGTRDVMACTCKICTVEMVSLLLLIE